MHFLRKSGVLLHPSSLPGPYGIGEIGPAARRFVEQLAAARQTYWQVLPMGPTGYGDSPYQSLSTFAGNPVFISFDDLLADGLLHARQLADFPEFPRDRVDFGPVLEQRRRVLASVCRAFPRRASAALKAEFKAFRAAEAEWLDDFALYMALKEKYNLRPWTEWAPELVRREPAALARARKECAADLRAVCVQQFLFDRQWKRLRAFAHRHGLRLVGDIPIFVSHDSADVWAHPELFYLEANGQPSVVAGVPPDYFSATGQLWGNPLYRWELHRDSGYAWWIRRMKHMADRFDLIRIDHFRGFEAYWEIPAGEPTAVRGRWVPGPGADLFHALRRALGDLPVIAEDLGLITAEVDALRDAFELPGMRILHFSFGRDLKPHLRPEGFPENCIVYTGTHDNDTTRGWFSRRALAGGTETDEGIEAERAAVRAVTKTSGEDIHWDLISLAWRLAPHTAIVPLQDVMGLGSEARMNVPGRPGGNWSWRFAESDLHTKDLDRLRDITLWAGRAQG